MTPGQLTDRTKRHPISKPQLEVLKKLAERGPSGTSTSTSGVYVSGTAAAALERRGLVHHVSDAWCVGFLVALTKEGRRVLARIERHGDACESCGHSKAHHNKGIGVCGQQTRIPAGLQWCQCRRYRRRT